MNKAHTVLGMSFGLLLCAAMVLFQSQSAIPGAGTGAAPGGAAVTLTSTQVGYGSGTNTVTSEAAFTYNATTDALTVGRVLAGTGSASAPGVSFASFTNYGMHPGGGILNFDVAGATPFILSATAIVPLVKFESIVGTGAAPGLTFSGDNDTGLSAAVANTLVLSAGGAGATLTTAELSTASTVYLRSGFSGAAAPAAGDCDADAERGRMYVETTNNRVYVCNGATRGWDYAALTD